LNSEVGNSLTLDWNDVTEMNTFPWEYVTAKLSGDGRKKFMVEEVYDMFRRLILNIDVRIKCNFRNSSITSSTTTRCLKMYFLIEKD
jgi:hypothetical protein